MRFSVVVLIPRSTEDIVALVTRMMDPYNLNHATPPRKEHFRDPVGIARLAAAFRLPVATPEAVAAELVAEGHEAGIDADGLYWVTTDNPRGDWDGWALWHFTDDARSTAAPNPDVEVWGVITPDSEWHDFSCGWDWPAEKKAVFQRQAQSLIATHPDCLAVILDCHR
ncbi:MAG TPA: hypothetical protein VF808_00640 [Ktedonobacterales bacterium]